MTHVAPPSLVGENVHITRGSLMREGSYILSTTRQLMFSLPEGCAFLPFLSRRGWNEFAAACTRVASYRTRARMSAPPTSSIPAMVSPTHIHRGGATG